MKDSFLFGGDPDSLQTTERWKYVGQGHGSYNEQSKLEYVGAGSECEVYQFDVTL